MAEVMGEYQEKWLKAHPLYKALVWYYLPEELVAGHRRIAIASFIKDHLTSRKNRLHYDPLDTAPAQAEPPATQNIAAVSSANK